MEEEENQTCESPALDVLQQIPLTQPPSVSQSQFQVDNSQSQTDTSQSQTAQIEFESDDEDLFDGYTLSTRKSDTGDQIPTDFDEVECVKQRTRGAPKGQKQQRRVDKFTNFICVVQNQKEECDRRRKLPFKMKKKSNGRNLHYFQCMTHKNCTYWELIRRNQAGCGDQRIIYTTEDPVHTKEFSVVPDDQDGIHTRWIQNVDLLIDSGRTPAQIRAQLILRANENNVKDQEHAMKTLPTLQQIQARKANRRRRKSMTWHLRTNADLLNVFQCDLITTRAQFDRVKSKKMLVWGIHTSKDAEGKQFSFMNFCTKEMLSVIPKAMKCYGKVLPLMGDGVHKLIVHDEWLLVFWGTPSRRFEKKTRKNRQFIIQLIRIVYKQHTHIHLKHHLHISCSHTGNASIHL